MRFELKHYKDLSLDELYSIMVLRQQVFVVEQNCAFLDCDGLDQAAWHLMYYDDRNTLVAYCRLLGCGIPYKDYASIGRVVSATALRREGHGRALMAEAIYRCKELFDDTPLKISAQVYLTRFYESLGFHAIGEPYLEDFIDHIAMIRYWQ